MTVSVSARTVSRNYAIRVPPILTLTLILLLAMTTVSRVVAGFAVFPAPNTVARWNRPIPLYRWMPRLAQKHRLNNSADSDDDGNKPGSFDANKEEEDEMKDSSNYNDNDNNDDDYDLELEPVFAADVRGIPSGVVLEDLSWRVEKLRLEEAHKRRFLKSGPRFLPYRECQKWVQAWGERWTSAEEWNEWIEDGEKRNSYIPSRPEEYYTRTGDWVSWEDFLGVKPEDDVNNSVGL